MTIQCIYRPIDHIPSFPAYAPHGKAPPDAEPIIWSDIQMFEMVGESMAPRYTADDKIFVYPPGTIIPGDDVLLRLQDGGLAVLRFVRQPADAALCVQFNPPAEIEFQSKAVEAIHLIIYANHVHSGVPRRAVVEGGAA